MIPVCEGLAKTSLYCRVDWSLVPALAHNQMAIREQGWASCNRGGLGLVICPHYLAGYKYGTSSHP